MFNLSPVKSNTILRAVLISFSWVVITRRSMSLFSLKVLACKDPNSTIAFVWS